MQEVNPAVGVIVKDRRRRIRERRRVFLERRLSGTPNEPLPSGANKGEVKEYLDLGSYALDKAETVNLDEPSKLPGLSNETLVTEMGAGVVRGDVANPKLAPMHPVSQRLADVLNRLSMNGHEGTATVTAEVGDGKKATTPPEALVQALMATGHSVVVADARYFANFGHFHFKGQDVMMPFFVDSQIAIPDTKRAFGPLRSLLVPVSHAEYEWTIRGPKVNADVSWYFGIDGKSEFRTMDTLDQAWVLGRHAHEYRDADAVEVTRLVGMFVIAFVHQHLRRPDLPFGGYYPLGVCQDGVAAIERKMTGHDTLFPNTADGALFDDPRDAEVNAMMLAIPKDRNGAPPTPERIFGSLPVTDFSLITIPGLAADLNVVHAAWQDGVVGADAVVDGDDEGAACDCGGARCVGWSPSVETQTSEEVIVAVPAPDATRLRGRGFLYVRENIYGDQEEGSKEVHQESSVEEVEFLAKVQSIGRQGR